MAMRATARAKMSIGIGAIRPKGSKDSGGIAANRLLARYKIWRG